MSLQAEQANPAGIRLMDLGVLGAKRFQRARKRLGFLRQGIHLLQEHHVRLRQGQLSGLDIESRPLLFLGSSPTDQPRTSSPWRML